MKHPMKSCITLLLLTVLFYSSSGQSIAQDNFKVIRGKVIEKTSKNPMPFSSVFIQGTTIGTITNENGEFTFNVPAIHKNDTLVVSFVGYNNFYQAVNVIPDDIAIGLTEAVLNLEEVSVSAQKLSGNEIFALAIKKLLADNKNPTNYFLLNGFYRELHTDNGLQTGAVECALEIRAKNVTDVMDDILIPQFRKVYDNQKSTDEFTAWKAGKNHLLLLLNGGANLVPLANSAKRTVWGNKVFNIEKLTYFNNKLVYVLSSKSPAMELKVLIDAEDYSLYKNELIMTANEADPKSYLWGENNTRGETCGAIVDHQSYEYRYVRGKMLPYYFFRKQDFRCFNLTRKVVTSKSYLSSELLINSAVTEHVQATAPDKLKLQKGLVNMKKPYDSAFWKHFNNIQDVNQEQELTTAKVVTVNQSKDPPTASTKPIKAKPVLHIGDHALKKFTRADTLFGQLTPLLTCYDVKHYRLDVDIDIDKEAVQGYSEMMFTMVSSSNKIRIDLAESMKINSIQYKGTVLKFERDLDAVYVEFNQTLAKGTVHTIQVNYEGQPADADFEIFTGTFIWQTDNNDNPFVQSLSQGYGAKGWWPVKNHLSDEPDSASMSITVPNDLVVVSNGKLIHVEKLNTNKVKYHWAVNNPINTYNIAVHIGKYEGSTTMVESVTGQSLPVKYFFLESDKHLAIKKLAIVPQVLTVYEKYFGAYPFINDGLKIIQSPYPMEHQSCIAVGQYFEEQLILHELAHEWWGNSVSCRDNADIWIHEAFATYAESLYIEETVGYSIGQEYLNSKKIKVLNDFSLLGERGVNHFHYRIEDKYFKGALMLNTLRNLVANDKLWFAALKGIQEEFRHSFIDTETLVRYFNQKLGNDYTGFFDQYLKTTAIPTLIIEPVKPKGFKYKWSSISESFLLPLTLDNLKLQPTSAWSTYLNGSIDKQVVEELEKKYLIKILLK